MFGRFDSAADWLANEDLKRRLILNPVTSADYKAISKMKRQRSVAEIEDRRQAARAKRRALAASRSTLPPNLVGYARIGGAYGRSLRSSLELKEQTNGWTTSSDMTGGDIHNLTEIAQGTSDVTRIGRKITIKKINVRMYGTVDTQGGGAISGCIFRFMLVLDQQTNGEVFAIGDLLESAIVNGFRNLNNAERFKVLKDKTVVINPQTQNGVTDSQITHSNVIKINRKCNIPITYSSTTGDITEVKQNNLYMLCITSSTAGNWIAHFRLRFADN